MSVIYVAIGGAVGAVLRYLVGQSVSFPYGTLLVNVLGSLAIGMLFVLMEERGMRQHHPLIMTGLLGGFTTFSTFSLDALKLFEAGQPAMAAIYAGGTLALCLIGCAAGLWLGRLA